MFFSSARRRNFGILCLAVTLCGCRSKTPGPAPRYAVLSFENLSGDASLDWTGRAAREMLSYSLSGAMDGPVLSSPAVERVSLALGTRAAGAPGISAERTKALASGANRLIQGYIEKAGNRVRITASIEDLNSGKITGSESVDDSSAAGALRQLAIRLAPKSRPYLTSNEQAVRLYSRALTGSLSAGTAELEQATAIDPNFGPAWLALVRAEKIRGDKEGAEQALSRARAARLDNQSRAELELEGAALGGDRLAINAALRKVAEATPKDLSLLRTLAESDSAIGDFKSAASDWRKLTDSAPTDPAAWNNLAYARAYNSDYEGAMAALREYARLRPADANPLDSMGDVNFMFRKFTDAAAKYQEANAKDPKFVNYGEPYKAAWAKFLAGDHAGAESHFSQFRAARAKINDPMLPLFEADWLYRTGRRKEGEAALRQTVSAASAAPPLRTAGYTQLTVWDLLRQDRAQAIRDAASAGAVTTLALAVARFSALPSASADEWKVRADRMIPSLELSALKEMALGYALIFDGKRDAALLVWEDIAKKGPATDFFPATMVSRLAGKTPAHELPPDPMNLNQFAAVPGWL